MRRSSLRTVPPGAGAAPTVPRSEHEDDEHDPEDPERAADHLRTVSARPC